MVESKHQWKAWLYLAPAIVLLLVFTVWPIINTVRLAFLNDYNSLSEVGGATFTVGIKNFQTVIGDSGFKTALKNTMLLCLFTVPISTILALLIAVALPFKILVLLGGLQGINKQYYDAAKVDSTPRWRVFTKITVPLLSPMIAYVVITGFIGGFKEYTSIVGIFGETMGPAGDAGRMNTIVGMIYDALPKSNYGVASAAALILFAIIFVVTMINMQVSKKRVHY